MSAFLTTLGLLVACTLGGIGAGHLFWGTTPQTLWSIGMILAGLALVCVVLNKADRD